MSRGENQKLKLAYLTRIMLEKTDEEHALTLAQIMLVIWINMDCIFGLIWLKDTYSDVSCLYWLKNHKSSLDLLQNNIQNDKITVNTNWQRGQIDKLCHVYMIYAFFFTKKVKTIGG